MFPEGAPAASSGADPTAPSAGGAPDAPGEIDPEFARLLREEATPELAMLVAERDAYLDDLRRLQADFDNYRRRVRSDTEMETARATEKLVSRLLPVLDTFELAMAHQGEPGGGPMAKVHDQLLSALEAEGLERLWPDGMDFDPAEAEAVVHEPGDGGGPVVSEVLRAGYRWKGRVMRAAMVKVRD
jgi:molecular chaperone GrpE